MLAKADERIGKEKAFALKMAVKGRIPKRKAQRERIQMGISNAVDIQRRAVALAEEALDLGLLSTAMLVLLRSLVRQHNNSFLHEMDRESYGKEAIEVFYRLSDLSKIEECSTLALSDVTLKSVLQGIIKKHPAWATAFLANGARALRAKLPRHLEDQLRSAFKLPPVDAKARASTSATAATSAPSTANSRKRGASAAGPAAAPAQPATADLAKGGGDEGGPAAQAVAAWDWDGGDKALPVQRPRHIARPWGWRGKQDKKHTVILDPLERERPPRSRAASSQGPSQGGGASAAPAAPAAPASASVPALGSRQHTQRAGPRRGAAEQGRGHREELDAQSEGVAAGDSGGGGGFALEGGAGGGQSGAGGGADAGASGGTRVKAAEQAQGPHVAHKAMLWDRARRPEEVTHEIERVLEERQDKLGMMRRGQQVRQKQGWLLARHPFNLPHPGALRHQALQRASHDVLLAVDDAASASLAPDDASTVPATAASLSPLTASTWQREGTASSWGAATGGSRWGTSSKRTPTPAWTMASGSRGASRGAQVGFERWVATPAASTTRRVSPGCINLPADDQEDALGATDGSLGAVALVAPSFAEHVSASALALKLRHVQQKLDDCRQQERECARWQRLHRALELVAAAAAQRLLSSKDFSSEALEGSGSEAVGLALQRAKEILDGAPLRIGGGEGGVGGRGRGEGGSAKCEARSKAAAGGGWQEALLERDFKVDGRVLARMVRSAGFEVDADLIQRALQGGVLLRVGAGARPGAGARRATASGLPYAHHMVAGGGGGVQAPST